MHTGHGDCTQARFLVVAMVTICSSRFPSSLSVLLFIMSISFSNQFPRSGWPPSRVRVSCSSYTTSNHMKTVLRTRVALSVMTPTATRPTMPV